MLSVLHRHSTLRFLLAARLVSSLGDWFTYMLLVVLSYARTGRAADAMAVLGSQAVATLLCSFVAGPLADRLPPVRLTAAADLARALLVGILFLIPVTPALYAAIAFLTAGAAAFFNPAQEKWVMQILPTEEYGPGTAVRQVLQEITKIAGPSLAVTVLALLGATHESLGFLLDAASFLASAVLLWIGARAKVQAPAPAQQPSPYSSPWREWRGLGPTLALPLVRTVVAVLLAVLLAIGGVEVVLLAFVRQGLGLSMLDVGYLITALSLGIIAGTFLSQALTLRMAPWLWLGFGLVGLGLFLALAALGAALPLTLASMAAAGFCNGIVNVNLSAYLQSLVPVPVAGRFFSLLGTLLSLATLTGMAVNSALLAAAGARVALAAIGAFIALAGLYGAKRLWGLGLPSAEGSVQPAART